MAALSTDKEWLATCTECHELVPRQECHVSSDGDGVLHAMCHPCSALFEHKRGPTRPVSTDTATFSTSDADAGFTVDCSTTLKEKL